LLYVIESKRAFSLSWRDSDVVYNDMPITGDMHNVAILDANRICAIELARPVACAANHAMATV
ncbi:hypothetical protein, partial [Caballeronia choica]|uniref:hypothetical protein n=1 Tax=Caballeronia choica TaxID=326476 RepID=UPI001F449FFA